MHYFSKHVTTDEYEFLVLEPEDWSPKQWQAILDIFGLKEAERIKITEYKMEVYGAEKDREETYDH